MKKESLDCKCFGVFSRPEREKKIVKVSITFAKRKFPQ